MNELSILHQLILDLLTILAAGVACRRLTELTYTDNHGKINEKKGSDRGIDGIVYTVCGTALFSVKSGKVSVKDVRELWQVVEKKTMPQPVFLLHLKNRPNRCCKKRRRLVIYLTRPV